MEEKGAFPVLSQANNSPSGNKNTGSGSISKLGCALKALKCSSRAVKEDDDAIIPNNLNGVDWTEPNWQAEFESDIHYVWNHPSSSEEQQQQQQQQQDPSSLPSSNKSSVVRISSEDTHDTQQVSNLDPNNKSKPSTPTEAERSMDEFCQKYFNTPKAIRSIGHLGDAITPLDSPADDDDDDDDEGEQGNSSLNTTGAAAADAATEHVQTILQFPDMNKKSKVSESSSSPSSSNLHEGGQELLEEKKEEDIHNDDDDDAAATGLKLNPDHASVQIGHEKVQTASKVTKAASNKSNNNKSNYEPLNTDSSFSSVSTFVPEAAAVPKGKHSNSKPVTPHPFFWRSHPRMTVTSYHPHQYCNTTKTTTTQRLRRVGPNVPPSGVFFSEETIIGSSSSPTATTTTTTTTQRQLHNLSGQVALNDNSNDGGGEFAPYLHPGVVRKMWMDSKPFQLQVNSNWQQNANSNRHPQGPPSARSSGMVQSLGTSFRNLPSVFSRAASSRSVGSAGAFSNHPHHQGGGASHHQG